MKDKMNLKRKAYHAFIGGMIGAAAGMGILTALLNPKHDKELEENRAEFYQRGLQQGRTEATSNLILALNNTTSNALTSLHFRVRGIVNEELITGYQKIAIAGAYMQGIGHLEDIQSIFKFHAEELAAGKAKIEDLQKKRIQLYGGANPGDYRYSKWQPTESN